MAKRSADEQITREGLGLSHDDPDITHEKRASADILAKRKILQPKGRNFSFKKEPVVTKVEAPSLLIRKAEKLKALGNKFLNAVKDAALDETIPDYRHLAKQYLAYYETIERTVEDSKNSALTNKTLDESLSGVSKVQKPRNDEKLRPINSNSELHSEDEATEVKVQGPAFKLSSIPTTKRTAFSFGPKTTKAKTNSDSDSDPEIEIKGPTFTFGKVIKDPVFKLQSNSVDAPGLPSARSSEQDAENLLLGVTSSNPESTNLSNSAKSNFTHDESESHVKSNEAKENKTQKEESLISASDSVLQVPNSSLLQDAEKETVLHLVKAKLMLLRAEKSTDPYQSLGIGELQVLKCEERSSLRVLLRAEGGLRLLLNALLLKDVQYSTLGNGSFVSFPALDDKHQIVTYVFKVGSGEKAKKLCEVLNAAKTS